MIELYSSLIRPLLFLLPPELAHKLGEMTLEQKILWRMLSKSLEVKDKRLAITLSGIDCPNPIGLAAGLDKNCSNLNSLLDLGFGYVVGGTVTLDPRTGNPKPRLLRYPKEKALVNALGFPGKGVNHALKKLSTMSKSKKPVMVSIAGLSVEEFVKCYTLLAPVTEAVELNISSPNTSGLKIFHEPETFGKLVTELNKQKKKPIFVKIPPYFKDSERQTVMSLVKICNSNKIDGITAINTKQFLDPRLKIGSGGLSGKPLFREMLRIIADIRKEFGNTMVINACGGISSADDAFSTLKTGANSIQMYTGLVYEGPDIVQKINLGLLKLLKSKKVRSVADIPSSQM